MQRRQLPKSLPALLTKNLKDTGGASHDEVPEEADKSNSLGRRNEVSKGAMPDEIDSLGPHEWDTRLRWACCGHLVMRGGATIGTPEK